jgi:hypothetical protein
MLHDRSCCSVRRYSAYWKNDPLDGDHEGKRYVLRQANITVHARNHADFQMRPPTLRPPVKAKSHPPGTTAEVTDHNLALASGGARAPR